MTSPDTPLIRLAEPHDAEAVAAIRADAIRHSPGVFSDEVPTADEADAWFAGHLAAGSLLVAADGEQVLGYACVAPLRQKNGYRHTGEDSIYLRADAQGRGIGALLLEALIVRARELDYHSLVALIEAGNTASQRLHQRAGFVETGRLRDAGWKFERWWDLVVMQRML